MDIISYTRHLGTQYYSYGHEPEDIKWRLKHEKCPGRVRYNRYNNVESTCKIMKEICTKKNCVFEYFKTFKTIDELFEI